MNKYGYRQTRSVEFKEQLRQKFVEECKKYIGVPYKKSLLEEGHQNYNAPLFLDCCALVRKAVNNLKKDFGFKLKRENQVRLSLYPRVTSSTSSPSPSRRKR